MINNKETILLRAEADENIKIIEDMIDKTNTKRVEKAINKKGDISGTPLGLVALSSVTPLKDKGRLLMTSKEM